MPNGCWHGRARSSGRTHRTDPRGGRVWPAVFGRLITTEIPHLPTMAPTLAERHTQTRAALARHFGYDDFRPAQRPVISAILRGSDTLGVLPTGAGKSVCFQIPAMVVDTFIVVVSPLISLMQDQVGAATARGIPAAHLSSTIPAEQQRLSVAAAAAGRLRLLYVSPERLQRLVGELATLGARPSLFVVDEAHCVTEWGHDFRPAYRTLRRCRMRLGNPPAVALTGSATSAVREDIAASLGLGHGRRYEVHVASFDRANLWFGVEHVRDPRTRLQSLLRLLAGDDRMAIVYASTRALTEALASALRRAGYTAEPYHAGLTTTRRQRTLEAFLAHEVEIITATSAFGMGIDKADVRLVVHWGIPPTPEAYYQEAGRAGRDGRFSRCIMLYHPHDALVHRRQLDVTFPPRRLVEAVWSGRAPRSTPRAVVDAAERLRRELRPERGPPKWGPVRRRRREAAARLAAVVGYASGRRCRRQALLAYFGERLRTCAGCDRCLRVRSPAKAAAGADRAARARMRTLARVLDRKGSRCVLDGPILARLAVDPPVDGDTLAEISGVGPAVAARLGKVILQALGALPPGGWWTASSPESPRHAALRRWRADKAATLGVAPFEVVTDATLRTLARTPPADPRALAAVPGVGPRLAIKWANELLALLLQPGTPPPSAV